MMNSNSVSPETSPQVRQKPHTAHARRKCAMKQNAVLNKLFTKLLSFWLFFALSAEVPTADTSDSSNDNHIPAPEQLLGENSSNQRKSQGNGMPAVSFSKCCYLTNSVLAPVANFFFLDEKIDELKIIFMEEEIRELKNALKEEKTRNQYLTQLVDQLQKNQLSHEKPRAPQ